MPYINVNLSKKVTPQQMLDIKSGIAKHITIIPNKSESVLMVDIEDGKTVFFRGEQQENTAYVDVRLYGTCTFEIKQAFTKAVFKLFEEVLGIEKNQMFLSLLEYDTWGTNGDLK